MKKYIDRAFLAGLLAFLLAVPAAAARWSRWKTTAYYENRALAPLPEGTWESLWDGSFGAELERWYSDHAPGRTTLLKADTALQMEVLDRPEVNGIVRGDGVLLPRLEYREWSRADYERTAPPIAEKFAALNGHIEANGGAFYFVGFPEQRVYFEDRFPAYMNNHAVETAHADEVFRTVLEGEGVAFLDMREVYAGQGAPEDYYSAVDHHFTYRGAYAAYRAVLDRLARDGWDLPVLREQDLEFQELPNSYIGSRNRKLYNLWPNGERAVIGVQKAPVPFNRTDNGQPSERPLFVLPAETYQLATYNLYMGGDFGETVLDTGRPELPDALIFGDSFTNAMETLLYASFDETRILDLRYYQEQSLKDYVTEHRPDIVLCVMNDTSYYTTTGNGAVWGP